MLHESLVKLKGRLSHRIKFHSARASQHIQNTLIPREGNYYKPHALRRHWLQRYAAGLIALKILVIGFVAFYAAPAHLSDITPISIIQLTNNARRQYKVPVLKSNALLTKAATSKANDMIRQQYFAHISPTNVTPWYWFKQAGYSYSYAGENLAIDFLQSAEVMKAWLNSPSHRSNLLSTRYKDIGVAVANGKINGVDSLLVVQMFGTPIVKPVVRTTSTSVQTPPVTVALQQAVKAPVVAPPPVVLGETISQPPAPPTILTPAAGSVVKTKEPTFVGSSEVGATVQLMIDQTVAGTAITAADGSYTLTLLSPLGEGQHSVSAQAVARGLISSSSPTMTMTVDTVPPAVIESKTFALFSVAAPDSFDVVIATSPDTISVQCNCVQTAGVLQKKDSTFVGRVQLGAPGQTNGGINVITADAAGNEVTTAVVDPELFSTGVVASSDSPTVTTLKVVFYSRTFISIFIVLMFILATLNVVIHLERQHHPTIIGTLLVIYLAGALLLI